jgi:hypothetical protein
MRKVKYSCVWISFKFNGGCTAKWLWYQTLYFVVQKIVPRWNPGDSISFYPTTKETVVKEPTLVSSYSETQTVG